MTGAWAETKAIPQAAAGWGTGNGPPWLTRRLQGLLFSPVGPEDFAPSPRRCRAPPPRRRRRVGHAPPPLQTKDAASAEGGGGGGEALFGSRRLAQAWSRPGRLRDATTEQPCAPDASSERARGHPRGACGMEAASALTAIHGGATNPELPLVPASPCVCVCVLTILHNYSIFKHVF